jgi:hypothetical protein
MRRKPGVRVQRLNDLVEDAPRVIGAERFQEHAARLIDAAGRDARRRR